METLSRLWMEGRTASQIAESLGNGITRNAVIGKAHRLGLCSGENVVARAETIASGALVSGRDEESADSNLSEKSPVDESSGIEGDRPNVNVKKRSTPLPSSVTIAELTDATCRWPVDEPGSSGFRYCGAPVAGTAPYCSRHAKLAYQPTKPVRRPPDRHALFPGLVASAPKS